MMEDKNPMWVSCNDCKNDWVIIYTPAPLDDVTKAMTEARCPSCQSKEISLGRSPQTVGISPEADAKDRIMAWFASGDTGVSSESIACEFIGKPREKYGRFDAWPPSDPADLGRCLRLLKLVPEARPCVDKLGKAHDGWKKAASVWDQITRSMIDEVGIDWSKGKSAPKTYEMMKDAGL